MTTVPLTGQQQDGVAALVRTGRIEGQHVAVAHFLAAIFDTPPPRDAALHADVVRRARNDCYYRAHEPTEAATRLAVTSAQLRLDAAKARFV